MDYLSIVEKLKDLSKVTPAEIVHSYGYLAAVLAEKSLELAEQTAKVATIEAMNIQEGQTAAQAKVNAQATPEGLQMLKLKAGLVGCTEMIRCLKRAQQYYSDEAKNLY